MRLSLRFSGFAAPFVPLSRWILPGLFAALGVLYVLQARLILKNTGSDSAPGATMEAMQARAGNISSMVMSYLQNHDADSVERIEYEGKEASRLLQEVRRDAERAGNAEAWAPVFKAHEDMRQATENLLAADHGLTLSRQTLVTLGDSLTAIMIARMQPSIRPSQLNSSERLQAVQVAAADARRIAEHPGDADAIRASQRRFHRAIQTYADLSGTRRARRWAEEAISLFDQGVGQAQDLQRQGERQQALLARYVQKKNAFDVVLQESASFRNQGFYRVPWSDIFSADFAPVTAGVFLLIVGMALAVRSARSSRTEPMPRLKNILSCIEAATTGDVSRIPEAGPPDEIGLLSRAVGRLIGVLARSENLVYHLAALVESSGDAIISHTLDGTVLSWNKGAQRLYGYSAEEMKGQSIKLLVSDGAGVDMERYLQKLREGERIPPYEAVHCARSGRRVCALVRVSAIYDSTRRIIGASFSAQELAQATPEDNRPLRYNGEHHDVG